MNEQQLQEVYNKLRELGQRFGTLLTNGIPPSDAFMQLQNNLVQQADIDPKRANAIMNLGVESFINETERRQHFSQEQLMQYWHIAFPQIQQQQQNQNSNFPKGGFPMA